MLRRAPAAALLVLLAVQLLVVAPVNAAPGPNARAPLATVGAVTQVALAQSGTILAVTDDPGSSLPTPSNAGADVPTWYIWDQTGALAHSGSSDMTGCASRLGDLCQSPAVAGAISADAGRFAVASNVAQSIDSIRGLLQVGRVSDATVVRQLFTNPLLAVALDRHGTTVAVVERIPASPGPGQVDHAVVDLFAFDGNTLSAVFPPYTINAPVAQLALALDGQRLAVAADHLYLFTRTPSAPAISTAIAGDVAALAIAPAAPHSLVAGYASGTLGLFDDFGGSIPRAALPLGAPLTAVATDGTAAYATDNAGKAYAIAITTGPPYLSLQSSRAVARDPGKQLALAPDGSTLALRSATELHLLQPSGGNLTELWNQKPATPPASAAIDGTGALTAAGIGSGVVLYDVSHAVVADMPTGLQVPPHAARDVTVTYRNNGNRAESVEVGVWFPANWFATVAPTAFDLPVGGQRELAVHLVVGANEPPGISHLLLNHTLASGGTGSSALAVEVVAKDAVALDAEGPASVALKRGETAKFQVRVTNHGNADAHLDLSSSTDKASWTATVSARHFDLAPNALASFQATLTAPANAADAEQGTLRLTLVGRPGSELDLTGVVGARFAPSVQVAGVVNAIAGATLDVNASIVNAGNVADAFEVKVDGIFPDGWTVQLASDSSARTGLLEPGIGQPVQVHIVVPAGASGQRVQVHLKAASVGDASKTADHGILVLVASTPGEGGRGSPGLEGPAIIAALATATLLAARQRRANRR